MVFFSFLINNFENRNNISIEILIFTLIHQVQYFQLQLD
jgi:hypothetical protein